MEQRDIPIRRIEEDELGVSEYVDALSEYIIGCDTPITISIQGEWGSGKTSFMKMIENRLCSPDLPDEERYESIWVNTWELFLEDNYEEGSKKLILSLIRQMEQHFDRFKKKHEAERRKEIIQRYLKAASSIALNLVNIEAENTEKIWNTFISNDGSDSLHLAKADFEKYLCKLVSEKDNGLTNNAFLIFIDDLDRLNPQMAVTLLEALKNLFDMEKCIFILAIDYEVIVRGVARKYGLNNLGKRNIQKDFFDKIIQVPYTIPVEQYNIEPMVIKRLKNMNFFSNDYNYIKYNKLICEITVLTTGKNPRAIKRLLNMTRLIIKLQRGYTARTPDFRVIELLLMGIQLAFPDVYTMISQQKDLGNWKKKYSTHDNNPLSTKEKEELGIDEEWKEIIYLEISDKEFIRSNYYRLSKLLEIYEDLQGRCLKSGERIDEALGVINVISRNPNNQQEVFYEGDKYDNSSQTQYKQGNYLINSIDFSRYERVLDVGCGNGITTLEMWDRNRDMSIDAFDLSESQIQIATEHYEDIIRSNSGCDYGGGISFFQLNALDLDAENEYDLVFSNATLHWITNSKKMYSLLYRALKNGGDLAIHQGGYGTYCGLHEAVREAIQRLDLQSKYKGFVFPVFYPEEDELKKLLQEIGFKNIRIESVKSDEKDNDSLVDNFANASLIFYKTVGLSDSEYEALKQEYFRICNSSSINKYSHRLYAYARKEEK